MNPRPNESWNVYAKHEFLRRKRFNSAGLSDQELIAEMRADFDQAKIDLYNRQQKGKDAHR